MDHTAGTPFKPEMWVDVNQCGVFNVTWKTPEDSGGGPILGIQVEIRKKNEQWRNCTSKMTDDSCLFSGLESDTVYDIRVTVYNLKGRNQTNVSRMSGVLGKCTIAG